MAVNGATPIMYHLDGIYEYVSEMHATHTGVSEAFVNATASPSQLSTLSRWMVLLGVTWCTPTPCTSH